MFYAYIYRDGDTPFYVGKGSHGRAVVHLRRKDESHMARKVRKLIAGGTPPSIEIIPALSEAHALFLEECLIQVIGRADLNRGPLLNHNDGGVGNSSPSAETRAKMSASHKGVKRAPFSAEHRAKIGLAQKDSKAVAEGRLKQAEKMRGRKEDPAAKAKRAAAISAGHQRRRERLAQAGA